MSRLAPRCRRPYAPVWTQRAGGASSIIVRTPGIAGCDRRRHRLARNAGPPAAPPTLCSAVGHVICSPSGALSATPARLTYWPLRQSAHCAAAAVVTRSFSSPLAPAERRGAAIMQALSPRHVGSQPLQVCET